MALYQGSDGVVQYFGDSNEITLTHVADVGLTITNTVNGTDDKPVILQLKSEEDAIVADDVIASLEFAAGDSDGTDGATVAAGIHAIAEGTFAADANATKLVFTTGVSETAASSASAKMTLSSAGDLSLNASNTELRFYEGANYVGFEAGALSGNQIWVLPTADGSDGQQLTTDGNGTLSWSAAGGSSADPASADGDTLGTASLEWSDLYLADGGEIFFGNDQDITLTHVADVGLTITHVGTGDNLPVVLQLKSEENAIVAAEVIASIEFAAGDSDGTDGATVAAGIHAIAEETFAADANATKLVFTAADSETAAASATAKMTLASTGNLTTAGTITAVGSFIIGSADMDETDLEKLDGITNGTAAAAKAVVLDASKNIATIGTVGCGAITSTGASSFGASTVASLTCTAAATFGGGIGSTGATITTGGAISADGRIITDDTTEATSTTDGSLQTDGGLSVAKSAVIGDDLDLLSDAAILNFGADKDVNLTHVADTGLLLNSTMKIQFNDASQFIHGASNAILALGATDEIDLTATLVDMNANLDLDGTANISGLLTVQAGIVPDAQDGAYLGTSSLQWSDLFLADEAVIAFGDDGDITLTHVADSGLLLKHVGTADGKMPTLTLQCGDNDIEAADQLGVISFQAPDEGAGTDAITVAASIAAVAEGDFSSSSNATSLHFYTGASEVAVTKVKITSAGHIIPTHHADTEESQNLGGNGAGESWANIFTTDLHLNNKRGNWTIVEEEDMLTIRNNKTGKWYKMGMTEIDPTGRDDGMASPPPPLP